MVFFYFVVFLHLLDSLKLRSICLLNSATHRNMFFGCTTYAIVHIIFDKYFSSLQNSIQSAEVTTLDFIVMTYLLKDFFFYDSYIKSKFRCRMGRSEKLDNIKAYFGRPLEESALYERLYYTILDE